MLLSEQRAPPPQGDDDACRGSNRTNTHGAVSGVLDMLEEDGTKNGEIVSKIAMTYGSNQVPQQSSLCFSYICPLFPIFFIQAC